MDKQKPDAALIGADGNVFNLIGITSRALKKAGLRDEAGEMQQRVLGSSSYEEALCIMGEYVNITGMDEPDMESDYDMEESGGQNFGMALE